MDVKVKELIAIGASITANCKPCLEYHFAKARENGATDKEISDAIAVAKMVRKGAASETDKFIPNVLE
jgi:AhpD family alkylhydroperoxidase